MTHGKVPGRDKQLANIAPDYCVNGDLIPNNVGEPITTVDMIHDKKYYGWSFEEVYDDLYENADKIDIDSLIDKVFDDPLKMVKMVVDPEKEKKVKKARTKAKARNVLHLQKKKRNKP